MLMLARNLILITETAFVDYVFVFVDFIMRCLRYLEQRFRCPELMRILYTLCVDVLFFPFTFTHLNIRRILVRNHRRLCVTNRTRIERDCRNHYNEMVRRLRAVINRTEMMYHDEDIGSNVFNLFVLAWKLYLLAISLMKFFIFEVRREYVLKKDYMLQGMFAIDNTNP